jgi:hypothetical protein
MYFLKGSPKPKAGPKWNYVNGILSSFLPFFTSEPLFPMSKAAFKYLAPSPIRNVGEADGMQFCLQFISFVYPKCKFAKHFSVTI